MITITRHRARSASSNHIVLSKGSPKLLYDQHDFKDVSRLFMFSDSELHVEEVYGYSSEPNIQ
jgi:hypothetical protein